MIAYCEDYDRRQRMLTHGACDEETHAFYTHLNHTIDISLDLSLEKLDAASRVAMRQDIACRRGATYSPLYALSPSTYKRYKRRAKYTIARNLGLIPPTAR